MVNEAISQDHNIPARLSSNIAKTIVCQGCDSRHRCSGWRIARSFTYFYRAIAAKIALHAFTDPCRYKKRFRLQYFILYLIIFLPGHIKFLAPCSPDSQSPFPEQSFKHKESAIFEMATRLLVVVSVSGNKETPRPLLASLLEKGRILAMSFRTRFSSSFSIKDILSRQSSCRCFKCKEAVPAFPENSKSKRQSWTYLDRYN